VLHPFVDAQMSKADCAPWRGSLGWGTGGTASGPLLASGIEDRLRVEPADLGGDRRVETRLCAGCWAISALRCRPLRGGWVVELTTFMKTSTQKPRLIIARVRRPRMTGAQLICGPIQ